MDSVLPEEFVSGSYLSRCHLKNTMIENCVQKIPHICQKKHLKFDLLMKMIKNIKINIYTDITI